MACERALFWSLACLNKGYGMVWHSMVWYGMAWHVMVWYGMVWYGMVWYGWYGMVWYGMIWYGINDWPVQTFQQKHQMEYVGCTG